jgi:hypothetical protein
VGLRGATDDPDVITLDKYSGMDTTPAIGPILPGGLIPERHDGVVIAYINQQPQTDGVRGLDVGADLGNIHSCGVVAGSCAISNTFLHLALVRHGSAFQVIDPWLTSWYVQLSTEAFYRDVGYGECTVGEAYDHGISLVGSKYVTQEFWWDIWENIILFGDPDIRAYTPFRPVPRVAALSEDPTLEGHSVMSAGGHPEAVAGSGGWAAVQVLGALALAVEGLRFLHRKNLLPRPRPRPASA